MISRGEAFDLVRDNIDQPNLVNHCVATEIVMEALARHFGLPDEECERWAVTGLLHDLDYATTASDPARHGLESARMLAQSDVDEGMVHAILAHCCHAPLESTLDKALYAVDPTTGFITAAALVRPDKDLGAVQVKSLTKRWKEKAFARGADRDQMATCESLDLTRDEFLSIALSAMQQRADEIGF